jgi:hypothetical protein
MRHGDRTALCGAVLLCAVYRRWGSLTSEKLKLEILKEQFLRASASRKAIVLTGDLNLNVTRRHDSGYRCKAMLSDLQDAGAVAGFKYHVTSHTFRSYRMHSDGGAPYAHCYLTIDHMYTAGVVASIKVLANSSSDHRPLVTVVKAGTVQDPEGLATIQRQNFKRLERHILEAALLQYDWAAIYQLRDVNVALKYLKAGIVAALDMVAPLTVVIVRKGKSLYLARDTLELMKLRDHVAKGHRYRKLHNRCSVLVERDKRNSNQSKLTKSKDDPGVLWELAKDALGKQRTSLPQSVNNINGSMTADRVATTEAMNSFYIRKIELLRQPLVNCPLEKNAWPPKTAPFEFKYCNAKKVAKIIKGLSNTTAVGADGISVIVLKLATDVLAGPISHVLNRSLSTGKVPIDFKRGIVKPIHKGGGKNRNNPGSYMPVCILSSLSKVLETKVKWDITTHFAKIGAVPTTQHGFRAGRSCTTALASAQAGWLQGIKKGKVVRLLGFNLSSASTPWTLSCC